MLKLVLSVICGLVLAFAIVLAVDALFHLMSFAAPPADANDKDAMAAYVAKQPSGVLAGIIVGWAIAAFAGAALAARLGRRRELSGWIVTGLFLLATIANFVMVTHPVWMVLAGIIAILVAGWLGSR